MSNASELAHESPEAKELEKAISEAAQEFDKKLKEAAAKAGVRIKTEISVSLEQNGQEGCDNGTN